MRGGFVACFGEGSIPGATPSELAKRLRWHRGTAAEFRSHSMHIAVLADGAQGPAVELNGQTGILTHGTAPAPLATLERRSGRFAALEWDRDRVRAIRDPLGEAPLFFRIWRAAVWFASEIYPLIAIAPARPDLQALAAEAAYVPYPMSTGWEGILRVPPGAAVELDRTMRLRVSPYWRPSRLLATRRCSYAEAVDGFRTRLEQAVARRRTNRTGVLLSGGLDSAAVAILARREADPPRLIHVTFPGFPAADETRYARAAAEAAGTSVTILSGRADRWDPHGEADLFGTTSTLLPTGAEVALEAFARDRVECVLDGHDGDGALGLYSNLYALLIAHLQLRRLVHLARRYGWRKITGEAIRDLEPEWLRRLRGLPPPSQLELVSLLRPFFRGETARRMAREQRWRGPRREWRRHQLLPLLPPITLVLEQMEMEAARIGVDVQHPFADRDLLEFLISLPFSVKVDPERSKPLLRDGLADVLPEMIRWRPDKTWLDSVLEHKIDPRQCLEWIRASGVRLPDVDYSALLTLGEDRLADLTVFGWIRLTRAHVFAAGG